MPEQYKPMGSVFDFNNMLSFNKQKTVTSEKLRSIFVFYEKRRFRKIDKLPGFNL